METLAITRDLTTSDVSSASKYPRGWIQRPTRLALAR
jgi:hypothetical protein